MPEAEVPIQPDDRSWESDSCRESVTRTAARILAQVPVTTVLDLGCGPGLLVQAFVVKGADASGVDVSEQAVSAAHPDVRDRLRVAPVTAPIDGRYDLITCIDLLADLDPTEAQDAIDAMAAATDQIILSSGLLDTQQWAVRFAERGFFRRVDADLSFLAPWAVLLERAEPSPRELVARYEGVLTPLLDETIGAREALAAARRETSRLAEDATGGEDRRRLEAAVREARHDLLVSRDQVIGSEAEVGRVNRDLTRLAQELRTTTRKLRRTTERRDELQQKLGSTRRRSEQQVQTLRARVAQLEGELAAARASFPRRVARAVRRRLR